ncbi:transglutaminase domain-containing protein [Paenibacillus sp. GSMTC-2017]|uniref:transglutaminase-like domain-containing protein n=1 Tax=Paenibacillus sp. GSMTC-2017 TaxID=2794350 RepID=UPI0018D8C9AF|nr:transglutaminase-like domain-containing protein [Paenibacillus sp. GSMTC-2017]MBH5320665.1 transglutaminase domain-containing protein [Paenibacillus sp. GSMTC-2017]
MRKYVLMLVAIFVLFTSVNVVAVEASEATEWLDVSKLSNGIVTINFDVKANVKTKVRIAKGTENYTYNLVAGKGKEQFPLQLGNGEYKVMMLENVSGKSYKVVKQETVELNLNDEKVVYLNSVQNVSWTSSNKAIAKAQELTANKKTDEEKVKAVYNYIVTNIAYDDKLAASVSTDYLPSIDRTLTDKKDICYGYSALFAAMLRSLDVPTKLVMGDSEYVDVYHAWNEVYLNGKWVTIDTTVDAGFKKGNKKMDMLKDVSKYTTAKEY